MKRRKAKGQDRSRSLRLTCGIHLHFIGAFGFAASSPHAVFRRARSFHLFSDFIEYSSSRQEVSGFVGMPREDGLASAKALLSHYSCCVDVSAGPLLPSRRTAMARAAGFSIAAFARTRPYLFHLTAAANRPLIERRQRLESASSLRRLAGQAPERHGPRTTLTGVRIGGHQALLRDQLPLVRGHGCMVLPPDWTLDDLRLYLDARVFFWPGTKDGGPVKSGWGHFATYERERPIVLRVRTKAMFAANPALVPEFARCNSGAPRCHPQSGKQPRGPDTFAPGPVCAFTPRAVVECTFIGGVDLPSSVEAGPSPAGPWRPLLGPPD